MIAFRNQDFDVAVDAWERYLEVAPPDAKRDRIRGMLEMARQNAGKGGSPP
jgi:cytochrome c-type biogenesis protein CcmH/NrfG